MSTLKLVGSLSVGFAIFATVWINSSQKEPEHAAIVNKFADSSFANQVQTEEPPTNLGAKKIPLVEDIETSEIVSEQVKDALVQLDEFSQYPPSSQPILSDAHVHSFMNTSLPQTSLPFPFDDLETPIQVAIELDQSTYFFGDQIKAHLNIIDAPENASISTRSVLMGLDGEVFADSGTQETKENTTIITFDTQTYSTANWPIEMNLGAYIDINGRSIFITAPFKINDETASLDSIGFSEPVEENLVIPINLNVKTPGYYHLAGILYSAKSKQPLIHLETEGTLDEGIVSLNLNAHIQALKKGADEGPYYLDKIRIERWSDEKIPRDISGKVDQKQYSVDGYSFTDYEDKPYLDPLAQERKRLLQGLSSNL